MSGSKATISEEDLSNFCAVTGATVERARFYVEAANGNLDLAIESFYEGGGEMDAASTGGGQGLHRDDDDDDEDDEEEINFPPSRPNPFARLNDARAAAEKKPEKKKPAASSGNSKIFTLSSLNNDGGDSDKDSDEEEKGQAFYAGGSETSGQQILGPPRRKNPEKIIKDLFEKAKESGAQEVDPNEASGQSSRPVVYGTGYRLGTGNEPSEVVPGPSRPKPPKASILKLWKNGFTVDDGPLRSFEDEKNKEFLASIQRGELPNELVRQAEGGEVHLDMQDHREEEFVPVKPAYRLYNDGYKLGSPTPNVVSNATPADKATSEELAKKNLNVDAAKPSTQIQIRLSDGSRLVIKANQTHRVGDIRRYINTARPEYSSRVYSLMTSFPNKELTNDSETLEEGKLLNAVIIQKL